MIRPKMKIAEAKIDAMRIVAQVIEHGAAAKALAEYDRRNQAGEDVRIYDVEERGRTTYVVGPPLTEAA